MELQVFDVVVEAVITNAGQQFHRIDRLELPLGEYTVGDQILIKIQVVVPRGFDVAVLLTDSIALVAACQHPPSVLPSLCTRSYRRRGRR